MARIICSLPLLLAFVLVGCSSPRPAAKKKTEPPASEKKAEAPAKAENPKPEPPKTEPAAKKEEPKVEPAKKAEPDKKEEPTKKEEPKAVPEPASVKDAPLGAATGYENEFAGGKTVRMWIGILDSGNKDQILEALAIFQMVGKRAGMAVPKLEVLAKHSDPEIAKAARDALQAVK